MSHPPPHIHSPTLPHKNTLILLHGTSQTGPSIASPFLSFPFPSPSSVPNNKTTLPDLFPTTRFISPTGTLHPTTVFSGLQTHAWFDIHSFSDRTLGELDSLPGLRASILYLSELVREEIRLLDGRGKVVLVGFSQGCAVLMMGLLSGVFEGIEGAGGVVGLSGWLPFRRQVAEVISQDGDGGLEKKRMRVRGYIRKLLDLDLEAEEGGGEGREESLNVPVWIGHGKEDGKVKMLWAEEMCGVLRDVGVDLGFRDYEGLGHWWGEEEMRDLAVFLRDVCGEGEEHEG